MNKDLRDPKLLGEAFLAEGHTARVTSFADYTASQLADLLGPFLFSVPNYDANPGPLEKYGRPQDLPSTLPN